MNSPSTDTTPGVTRKRHPNWVDVTGQKFGRLTAISYEGARKWKCLCDCGHEHAVALPYLRSGHTKSCGCIGRRNLVEDGRAHQCNDCGREREVDAFYAYPLKSGVLSIKQPCKECRAAYQRLPDPEWARARATVRGQYARKRKTLLDALKSKPCPDCKRTYPPACMDFDHVRGVKRLHIAALRTRSLTLVMNELKNCELVCSNCHRIRTAIRRAAKAAEREGVNMSLPDADKYVQSPTYPIVQLAAPFLDKRGSIQNITTKGARSVASIFSAAGSSRASHVHCTDDHLAYVIRGRVEYWWQDVRVVDGQVAEREGEIRHVVVETGQAFYTPKNVAHTMHFPEDTFILTLACQSREHADHEADLIRVHSLKPAEGT